MLSFAFRAGFEILLYNKPTPLSLYNTANGNTFDFWLNAPDELNSVSKQSLRKLYQRLAPYQQLHDKIIASEQTLVTSNAERNVIL